MARVSFVLPLFVVPFLMIIFQGVNALFAIQCVKPASGEGPPHCINPVFNRELRYHLKPYPKRPCYLQTALATGKLPDRYIVRGIMPPVNVRLLLEVLNVM